MASNGGIGPVVSDVVVGWVHGQAVTTADVDSYLMRLAPQAVGERLGLQPGPAPLPPGEGHREAVRAWAAKSLLLDRLLEQEAARFGVADPRSAAEWARRLDAAGEIAVPEPSTAAARSYFLNNRHRYRVTEARRVHHVLVDDRSGAGRLLAEVPDLAALSALARRVSLDEGSRAQGGDLGWVEQGQLAGPLEQAIFSAPLGRVVGPVGSVFGWHLLAVASARRAGQLSFADCRQRIMAELEDDHRQTALRAWLDGRLALAVTVPEGAEHPLSPGLPGSAHRH